MWETTAHKHFNLCGTSFLGEKLGNLDNRLWVMQNGYALVSEYGLMEINSIINSSNEVELDELRNLLRIGIQWHTEVTIGTSNHSVTQVYCSALPVSYSPHPAEKWATFARFILEASYEAVLCAGLLNAKETGNNKIYLTLLGGGAFGNQMEWIIQAIRRSLVLYHWSLTSPNDLSLGFLSPNPLTVAALDTIITVFV